MSKRILIIMTTASLLSFIIFVVFIFSTVKDNTEPDKKYMDFCNANYRVFAFPLPDTLYFCGERVPMERIDVRESLDLELLKNVYWHSATFLGLKRSNRMIPIIDSILKKNKIPLDFKYLAITESNLGNETSPAGAKGIWQFLSKTASYYGLEVNEEVDERYHLEKSTEAACKYLKDSYSVFKNWTMVAASYNMGTDGLSKQAKQQQTANYYDLLLNDETARYVYRILAVKMIFETPQKFGFIYRKKDLYHPIPMRKINVDSAISDLVSFAKSQHISYKILKRFNPWLRKSSLPNKSKQNYIIEIPIDTTLNFYKNLPELNNDTLYLLKK